MQIISRTQWGARHPDGFRNAPLPAQEVWLHHSVTLAPDIEWVDADGDGVEDDEERAMRDIEQIGQNSFGGGFSYTFAVMPSGRIYQGHSVHRQGAHTYGRNDIARAIVLVGNYETNGPTEAQKRSVAWLAAHGEEQGWWTNGALNGGHRDVYATACPGKYAYAAIPEINRLAASGEPLNLEDDMPSVEEVWSKEIISTMNPETEEPGPPYVSPAEQLRRARHYAEKGLWAALRTEGGIKTLAELIAKQNHIAAEDIAAALAPQVIAALPEQMDAIGDDDLATIATAVNDERDRRERARLEGQV